MLSTGSVRIKPKNPRLTADRKIAALGRARERVEHSLARARGCKRRRRLQERIALLRECILRREVA